MSVDEMHGMLRAFKDVKDYCEKLKHHRDDDSIEGIVDHTLNSVQKMCTKYSEVIQENIDGEIERMYEMMEGKKDDRKDHRDV